MLPRSAGMFKSSFCSRHINRCARLSCHAHMVRWMNCGSFWMTRRGEEYLAFRRSFPMILAFVCAILPAGNARAQAPAAQPDLERLAEEAQGWLADLIRVNTTNPPGNDLAAA